jgi:diguanylate cyclase (GGDEF)-like protein
MKAGRIGNAASAAEPGQAIRRRRAEAADRTSPVPNPLGVPDSELTLRVRETIMHLAGEVETLNVELRQTRLRLEQAEHQADRDQLLPVLNRRAFVRELTRQIAVSARYDTPASVVYFDLDDFKRINDTYGHAGGDAVLAHFAATVLDNVRESDVVGRLGGDEFAVILSHANGEQADRKAKSLIDALSARPTMFKDQAVPVGVSFGAFELRAGEDAESAMARADQAMYRRKRTPRG